MPSEPPSLRNTSIKSTKVARRAIASGPAAFAETRKNKKERMSKADQASPAPPTPATYSPAMVAVGIPVEAVIDDIKPHFESPALVYPPSEPSYTPPPAQPTTPPDEDIPTGIANTPDPFDGPGAISIRALLETTPHIRKPTNRNAPPPRDPLANYTKATMPKVHDALPTSPFNYMDLDLVSEWENFPGGKLLIAPFGDIVNEANLHGPIKSRILYAMVEIAQSQEIGVSAPTPNASAIEDECYPTSFLVYNLTNAQKKVILDRGVWSSRAITVRAIPFFPTNPDFMFAIKGFSTLIEKHVRDLIKSVWHDNDTAIFTRSVVDSAPEGDRITLIMEHGGALTPVFNVYANGRTIPHPTMWLNIRNYLADKTYSTQIFITFDLTLLVLCLAYIGHTLHIALAIAYRILKTCNTVTAANRHM
ncbi:hypothetical protein EDB84DRAFT_1570165 [Lactarius hengduanensis]|nr:hypothetical protein EDB84DRAFT_1570165 [Lactarius hengduanensis]